MPRDLGSTLEPEQLTLFEGGPNVAKLRIVAARMAQASQSVNTKKAYASDWVEFSDWCEEAGRLALPATPDTLKLYIVDHLDIHKVSTVERRLAAVVWKHETAGHASPYSLEIRNLMRGARRELGTRIDAKAALAVDDLKRILVKLGYAAADTAFRDRALMALGFTAALRRSEIGALDVSDLEFTSKGVLVNIRRSKTDQQGRGRKVGVFKVKNKLVCPVRLLQAWLKQRAAAHGATGPLFPGRDGRLTGQAVNQIVKRAVKLAGLDASKYGAHSLRAGFVTAAAENGVPETIIMQRTGHRSVQTVARYVRPATVFSVDALARAF
jgi:integrase